MYYARLNEPKRASPSNNNITNLISKYFNLMNNFSQIKSCCYCAIAHFEPFSGRARTTNFCQVALFLPGDSLKKTPN